VEIPKGFEQCSGQRAAGSGQRAAGCGLRAAGCGLRAEGSEGRGAWRERAWREELTDATNGVRTRSQLVVEWSTHPLCQPGASAVGRRLSGVHISNNPSGSSKWEWRGASPPPSPPDGGDEAEMVDGQAGPSQYNGSGTGASVVVDGVYDWGCISRWARWRGDGHLMERWSAQMSEEDRRKARGLRFEQEYGQFKDSPAKFMGETGTLQGRYRQTIWGRNVVKTDELVAIARYVRRRKAEGMECAAATKRLEYLVEQRGDEGRLVVERVEEEGAGQVGKRVDGSGPEAAGEEHTTDETSENAATKVMVQKIDVECANANGFLFVPNPNAVRRHMATKGGSSYREAMADFDEGDGKDGQVEMSVVQLKVKQRLEEGSGVYMVVESHLVARRGEIVLGVSTLEPGVVWTRE
jgi:hypothetical protein